MPDEIGTGSIESMQDHEVRAGDLNRKLIFSFFLLFS